MFILLEEGKEIRGMVVFNYVCSPQEEKSESDVSSFQILKFGSGILTTYKQIEFRRVWLSQIQEHQICRGYKFGHFFSSSKKSKHYE